MALVWLIAVLSAGTALANAIEKKFIAAGLVDIHTVDASIEVDLVNSDPGKNFFRKDFYNGLRKAYLRKQVAFKLSAAQKHLKARHPSWSLLVLDAARPRSVSRQMYETMKGTRYEKFVAHPDKGSMHNYGIAVDITIVDEKGAALDMGASPFRKSTIALYWQLMKKKLGAGPSAVQARHRKLLADVMTRAGFLPLSFEWWHFNGMPKPLARKTYPMIE